MDETTSKKIQNIYSTGASVGKIFSIIFLVICIFFGIGAIYVGIKYLVQEPSHLTEYSKGIVKKVNGDNCKKYVNTNGDTIFECSIVVEYKVISGNKENTLTKNFNTKSNIEYRPGNDIIVHYNPNHPSEASIGVQVSPKTTGVAFLIGGIFIILFGILYYNFLSKHEEIAALVGIGELMNFLIPFRR